MSSSLFFEAFFTVEPEAVQVHSRDSHLVTDGSFFELASMS